MTKLHHYDECRLCLSGDICPDSTAAQPPARDPWIVRFVAKLLRLK